MGTRELVAIKRMDKRQLIKDPAPGAEQHDVIAGGFRVAACVWRERHAWADFRSPGLVELLHAFQDDTYLYLIMPLYAAGDLTTFLENHGPIPEAALRFYAAELILAIEALHARNIIFRDLKPQNILMHESGHISLSDYGLCRPIPRGDGITDLRDQVGTRGYQPPEQLSGRYSFPADFFALGVTLFRLLTNQRLFERNLQVFKRQIPLRPMYSCVVPPPRPQLREVAFDVLASDDPANDLIEVSAVGDNKNANTESPAVKLQTGNGASKDRSIPMRSLTSYNDEDSKAFGTNFSGTESAAASFSSNDPGTPRASLTRTLTGSQPPQRASSFNLVTTNGGVEDLQQAFFNRPAGEIHVSLSWEILDLIAQLVNIDPTRRLGTPNRIVSDPNPASPLFAASTPRASSTTMSPLVRSRTAPDGAPQSPSLHGYPEDAGQDTVDTNEVELEDSTVRRPPMLRQGSNRRPHGRTGSRVNIRLDEGGDDNHEDDYLDISQVERLGKEFAAAFGASPAAAAAATNEAINPRSARRPSRPGLGVPTRTVTGTNGPSSFSGVIKGKDENGNWRGLHAGFVQIKNHPFFAGLDWDAIADRRVKPPIRPIYNMSRVRPLFPKPPGPKRLSVPEPAQALFRGFEYKTDVSEHYFNPAHAKAGDQSVPPKGSPTLGPKLSGMSPSPLSKPRNKPSIQLPAKSAHNGSTKNGTKSKR